MQATDVLIIHAADGATITGQDRANFETFLRHGGGVIVLHDGIVGNDPQWFKTIVGGAWENGHAKWFEGEVGEYFVDPRHPITRGISNFDWDDEIYFELQMMPDAHVLATSFQSVFVIAPQLWTYEKTLPGGTKPYRAFVSIPGHQYASFNTPHYRALLLRGIAWAAGRSNVDEFCQPAELASLQYPEGGPTAPQKAAASLSAHPDFEISLVASEPLIEKVISLDWDPRGRLWVAETPEYPNGRTLHRNDLAIHPERVDHPDQFSGEKEDRPAHDRVSWLEDTNGDGVMDAKHIFYEGLELVTSLVFYKDGVIVAQAPDVLWLRDTDGDGKADRVEKLYTGFGTTDAHAVINNLRWGMDGWIYSTIGYSAGNPKSGDGSKEFGRVTAGVIRFRPDGSALEQVASGSCNTWGLDFAPDGELFYTTATCGEHFLHVVMPEKVLARGNVGNIRASAVLPDHQQVFPARKYTRQAYMQIDWVGMFTAAAGCCIYNGGAWPGEYDGSCFLSDPTVNIVHNDFPRPSGATFVAGKQPGREKNEFITATDLWFRPIHTRVGPDGALYVVDFYNQAVVHNDPRGPAHGARNAATRPDRDHKFGRIWRVQHKQPKSLPVWKLDVNEPANLVRMLGHPNGWVRGNAQRLLQEKAPTANTVGLLAKAATDAASSSYARIHALWTLANLDSLSLPAKMAALNADDAIVLKNAIRIAALEPPGKPRRAPAEDGVSASLEGAGPEHLILSRCSHPDARVRLAAITALAAWPLRAETCKTLVELFPLLNDPWLESAVIGLASSSTGIATNSPDSGFFLLLQAAFSSPHQDQLTRLVTLLVHQLALKQEAQAATHLVTWLSLQPPSAASLKQASLRELAAGLKPTLAPTFPNAQLPEADFRNALRRLLQDSNPGVASAALPLVARWDSAGALRPEIQPITAQLSAKLRDPDLSEDTRAQIAVDLIGVRQFDASALPAVAALLTPPSPVAL
ncbi:MAG TPA: PVC-type heme-binding CxxCH protein, partial [Methylomirabilota bacterium]|nr:PVC-type heme-binding CxxCH protein [Methylomirabilota bacterium]